eukprot:CAMPEP_0196585746 /NCGR_PEP_ID=MMETSP1081-20130531/51817_1 /TAXON_ID=36882 /ORGANISM="Pyramimonas amylifera, Strain CCMP720" /LENGTH=129 /DNA_ID=CAMNT_0041907393 /DNA_START=85 /DNA_END=474 /DNA_ORIENTATION=-
MDLNFSNELCSSSFDIQQAFQSCRSGFPTREAITSLAKFRFWPLPIICNSAPPSGRITSRYSEWPTRCCTICLRDSYVGHTGKTSNSTPAFLACSWKVSPALRPSSRLTGNAATKQWLPPRPRSAMYLS